MRGKTKEVFVMQKRSFGTQAYFAKHTNGGQPALCIITKE